MTMSLPNNCEYAGRPKCARCRHHGIVILKKGHTKVCPFLKCDCCKCHLITQRTKIAALQREMQRTKKEQRPGAGRVRNQGDGEAPSTSTPAPMGPPSVGAPGKGTPADPWSRPEPEGESLSGSERRDVLPSASGKCAPLDSTCFSECRQVAPLPLIQFPFRMSGYYPSSYSSPSPHFLPSMPWMPPVPTGFGPLMFPHPQRGAVSYPPPPVPGPPAGYRQVFFTRHPLRDSETFKEEQHPPPPLPGTTEQDTAQHVNRENEL